MLNKLGRLLFGRGLCAGGLGALAHFAADDHQQDQAQDADQHDHHQYVGVIREILCCYQHGRRQVALCSA